MESRTASQLVDLIASEEQLEERLTRPGALLVDFVKTLSSPLVVLGAGGKMGPTLSVLARRAAELAHHTLEVIAVSRFSDPKARAWLEQRKVKTISCDLLDPRCGDRLPVAENIIYLVGQKFGTAQNPAMTWAVNTLVPSRIAERYANSRMVALSTGNVYPLSNVSEGGSLESAALTPLGEYANAAVGRERIFEFCSRHHQTKIVLLRLFYAVEVRYGVLVDIARKIYAGEPVEMGNGHFNCIWQGDANEMVIRALSLATVPPSVWNLCHPEQFSVRQVATRFSELFGRAARLEGVEAPTALLGNSGRLCAKLGTPSVSVETMMGWIALWIKQGGRDLGKPTHFEVRDGNY
jgi:nucleoside-diphosphate-sugar epimerase